MSDKIEDVVKRLRDRAEARRRRGKLLQIDDRMFDLIADEVEEAAKALEADRDNWRRQALDEDARANATRDKSSQVGNAAAMRKALVEIYNEIRSYCIDYGAGESHKSLLDRIVDDPPDYTSYRDSILKIDRIAESALSAPPRNCDRFKTKEEAALTYAEECNAFIPQSILWQIGEWINWLFAEAKGESND